MKRGTRRRLRPTLVLGAAILISSVVLGLERYTIESSEVYIDPKPITQDMTFRRLDEVRTPEDRVQDAPPSLKESLEVEKVEVIASTVKRERSTLPSRLADIGHRVIRTHTVVATGYNAGFVSTGKRPGDKGYGITYSGVTVHRGKVSTIAADKNIFPVGTILDIPGYGIGIVADTGSAIKGYKIDLYFDESDEWIRENWGKRTIEVKVLKIGNGRLTQEEFDSMQ